jgi:hypothetical protein
MIDPRHLLPVLALALLPAAAIADDLEDLDVTMEVLDTEGELDILVRQMRGPEHGDADRDLGEENERIKRESPFVDNEFIRDDDFERDNVFRKDPLTKEDDWESIEGEDLNLDLPEPEPEVIDPVP